jgi:sugar/nucleoside kinase (ribokinase family)
MSVDVVCAGVPFLDITFTGLERMPTLGEERMAERVQFTAGGLANIALGLHRLGLRATLWSPIGEDVGGRLLASLLAEEGIAWVGPAQAESAISAILPLDGDRAFVTVSPPYELDTDAIAALGPRAVVTDLGSIDAVPPGPDVYAVTGDVESRELAGRLPEAASRLRALLVNEPEACFLAGADDAEQAAVTLAAAGMTVVVTCGPRGAVCAAGAGIARTDAPAVRAVDTNGAGDLFTAAWVWADLACAPVADRLRLAVTYASLSVRVATTHAGALTLDAFRREADLPDALFPRPGARR